MDLLFCSVISCDSFFPPAYGFMLLIRAVPLDDWGGGLICSLSQPLSVRPARHQINAASRKQIRLRVRQTLRFPFKTLQEDSSQTDVRNPPGSAVQLPLCSAGGGGDRLNRIERNPGSDRLEYISCPQTQHDLLLQHRGFSADQADLKDSLQS